MDYIEQKYLLLLSPSLSQWHQVAATTYRFRCPFCGDSKKSSTKTRGYFYPSDDTFVFKCHNCGQSMGLYQFMKEVSPSLCTEYRFEKFRSEKVPESPKADFGSSKPKFKPTDRGPLSVCTPIKSLDSSHHARAYLEGRKLPTLNDLWYCEDVSVLAKRISGYEDREMPARDCVVIPFFSETKDINFLQCRFFDENFRYMTFQVADEAEKIWGLHKIDWGRRVSITEGPFDAMFVDNCLAIGGAQSVLHVLDWIKTKTKEKRRVIFDLDYKTNKDVYALMRQVINQGDEVVLFGSEFLAKDINKQVTDEGWSVERLNEYLDSKTKSGLAAKLEFAKIRLPEGSRRTSFGLSKIMR